MRETSLSVYKSTLFFPIQWLMLIFFHIWSSTDSLPTQQVIWVKEKTLHLKHPATRLQEMKYAFQFQPQPLLTDWHTLFCVHQHTDQFRAGSCQAPNISKCRSHNLSGNLFYYSTTLTAALFSLCLIWLDHVPACACCPLILLTPGKSWALSTHSKMQLWKKTPQDLLTPPAAG